MFRIWVPDLDSPSYFVAIAAVELGFFKQEGVPTEFVYNTMQGPELMREGKLDFIAGPAYAGTRAFPGWNGLNMRAVAVFILVPGGASRPQDQTR